MKNVYKTPVADLDLFVGKDIMSESGGVEVKEECFQQDIFQNILDGDLFR